MPHILSGPVPLVTLVNLTTMARNPPNPNYANNSQYSSVAESNYHGLHLSFVQRPAQWANFRVSYTLSKSMNNVGENLFSSPIDPFDLSKDWGRSDDDQRHRLVFNGVVHTSMDRGATLW